MTDAIPPALTPEEWDQWHSGERWIMSGDNPTMLNRRAYTLPGVRLDAMMALANAALPDESPYKITRADLEVCGDAIATIDMTLGAYVDPEIADPLRKVAAKLAALLPPE